MGCYIVPKIKVILLLRQERSNNDLTITQVVVSAYSQITNISLMISNPLSPSGVYCPKRLCSFPPRNKTTLVLTVPRSKQELR